MPAALQKLVHSLIIFPLLVWINVSYADALMGNAKLITQDGNNIFLDPQPISGDLNLISNTMIIDPFPFPEPIAEWVTNSIELLDVGTYSRPDGAGGFISATVSAGQLGAYMNIDWFPLDNFYTFMIWDVSNHNNGATYTTVDSDGDGIPGHAINTPPNNGNNLVYDFIVGEPPSGIDASIIVDGGLTQECAEHGGNTVTLSAVIELLGGAELGLIEWFIDKEPAGTGETVSIFLPLGTYLVEVNVSTTTGESSQDSVTVTIQDTTAPDLIVSFLNQDGEPINSIDTGGYVTTKIRPDDACDPNPETEGAAMPVHAVNDGDAIRIQEGKVNTGKINTVELPTTGIKLSAKATDASGNQRSGMAVLFINK